MGDVPPLLSAPFYFVRHGESEANAANVVAGSLDSPLTALGRRQAERAAQALRSIPVASLYSSPLRRAFDTATSIGIVLGLPVQVVEGLAERHWGVLEGQSLSGRRDYFAPVEGGEDWPRFAERTWRAASALAGPVPRLIVAHAGTLRALKAKLGLGLSAERFPNAAPVRFDPPAMADGPWRMSIIDVGPSSTP